MYTKIMTIARQLKKIGVQDIQSNL